MVRSPPDSLKLGLVAAAAALLLGVGHGIHDLHAGDPVVPALLPALSFALQTAVLSLGLGLARRRGWTRWKAFVLGVLVSLGFGGLAITSHARIPAGPAAGAIVGMVSAGLGIFALWLLVFYFPGELSAARLRALAAESELRKAELARLRASLHPHFLLNSLNAVAGLLTAEPREARQLVSALGDLLRDLLEEDGEMRPLEQEVGWLRRCAEIFEIRHGGAIRFAWDPAADSLALPVPRLLLQPLLENAIEHGALHRPGGGTVTARSRTAGDKVSITVSDDGPGMGDERPAGLGLRLVEDRLRLADPAATMTIDSSDAGTGVTLEVPRPGGSRATETAP